MKLIDPHQSVVNEEPSHVIAVRPVEIERAAPRRLVAVREIRSVLPQIISLGAEMVVDDVERHRETALMRGVNQSLERARTAVRILHRADVDAVVSPV